MIGMKKMRPALAAVIICFPVLSGCVFIPTTGHSLQGARAVASFDETAKLTPGTTTRADVLLTLGTPTDRLKDDRFFLYGGTMTEAYLLIGAGYAGAAIPLKRGHVVILEFTPDNVLRRAARFDDFSGRDLRERADRWMDGTPAPPRAPETEPPQEETD